MEADEDALAAIVRESGGSVRDATSLLDQVLAFSEGKVDRAAVGLALGLPDLAAVRELLEAVAAREPGRALEVVGRVVGQGSDLVRFSHEVLQRLRNLTVLAVAGAPALADLTKHEIDDLERSREGIAVEDLQRWFRILLAGHEEVARSTHPRMVLEMAVIRMASLVPLSPLDQLVARLEALEQGGGGAGPGARERPAPRGPMPRTTPPPPRTGAPESRGPRASEAAASAPPRPMARPVPENGHGPATGSASAPSRVAEAPLASGSPGLQEARPATPASAAPGADSAEQKRWAGLVAGLQREKASRFFRLAYSRVIGIGDGVIRIAVTGREAVAALGEHETKAMIEKAIEREYGQSLRFEAVAADSAAAAGAGPLRADPMSLERQGREDPLVRMSVEILDGKVEGVVARTRREGSS
jgi:DNA polymerase III gamma/tau subunit